MFLFRPVVAGIWRQRELWDGTYTVDDLMDAHAVLDWKEELSRRLTAAANGQR